MSSMSFFKLFLRSLHQLLRFKLSSHGTDDLATRYFVLLRSAFPLLMLTFGAKQILRCTLGGSAMTLRLGRLVSRTKVNRDKSPRV